MAKYAYHRVDANAALVIEALRKAGACVEPLGRPVDVLVTIDQLVAIAEIKTAKGKIRSAAQASFFKRWTGPCALLRTVEDSFQLVAELRWMASVLHRVGWPTEKEAGLR